MLLNRKNLQILTRKPESTVGLTLALNKLKVPVIGQNKRSLTGTRAEKLKQFVSCVYLIPVCPLHTSAHTHPPGHGHRQSDTIHTDREEE